MPNARSIVAWLQKRILNGTKVKTRFLGGSIGEVHKNMTLEKYRQTMWRPHIGDNSAFRHLLFNLEQFEASSSFKATSRAAEWLTNAGTFRSVSNSKLHSVLSPSRVGLPFHTITDFAFTVETGNFYPKTGPCEPNPNLSKAAECFSWCLQTVPWLRTLPKYQISMQLPRSTPCAST